MTDSIDPTSLSQVTATRTSSFLGSLGINTHLGFWDTSWGVGNGQWAGAESKVLTELNYLGVKNIRDSTPQGGVLAEMSDLGRDGYHFDLVQRSNNGQVSVSADIASLTALQASAPGCVTSYEGANEYNSNTYMLNGQNSNGNLSWGALDDQVSRAALEGSRALGGVTYVAASTASVSAAPTVTPYVDASNWHVYAGDGQQLQTNLAGGIAAAAATAPGKPVIITEAGISSAATSQTGWGSSGDEFTQGLIDTNAVLDAFKDGASQTYLYDLMDNNQAADLEDNFGLFNADGTPKAAATDIHNLTAILADTGSAASTFATTSTGISLSGLPAGASDMLLEKSSGTYDLVLWNSGATVWNLSNNSEAYPATSNVAVQLDGTHQTVKVYDPLASSNPVQTLTNVSSLSVGLSKDPLILEISAGANSAVPPPTQIGNGTQTLTLQMSEDAWEGNANFTVSIDGQQVVGTQTAVASHGQGQNQEFDVLGNWGSGAHQVTVDFLNDAYGGTEATDRNLYTDSASYQGSSVAGAANTFWSAGSYSFTLPASAGTSATPATQDGALPTGAAPSTTPAVIDPGAIRSYDFSDGQDHSLTTSPNAIAAITLGTGQATLTTQGTDTILGGAGSSTISALSGSLSVTGGSGGMTFIQGAAASSVALGSGAALIDIVQGMAGGSLTVSGFAEGKDFLHLSGYAGTGIKTEQVVQGSTQIVLTDDTRIQLSNFTASNSHSIFT